MLQITEHVWMFPPAPQSQPTVGVICTATQTVLVDAGNSPAHARQVLNELKAINAPPVKSIIYTHHHWDHIFGACVYNVPVIAHETCFQRVSEYARHSWGPAYLREAIAQNPRLETSFTMLAAAMGDWSEFEIILPSIVFNTKKHALMVDDLTLELEHVGGNHTDDSTVVRVVEESVIFLGDCYYLPPLHLRTPESTTDEAMVAAFRAENLRHYIDGHNGILPW